MTSTRYFSPARSLHKDLDRMLTLVTQPASTMRNRSTTTTTAPALQVWETSDHYTVKALIPGADRDSLSIEASPKGLALSGKVILSNPEATLRYSEFQSADFSRTITLPTPVKVDEVAASYIDGILSVTLPKAEVNRVVKVQLPTKPNPATVTEAGTQPEVQAA